MEDLTYMAADWEKLSNAGEEKMETLADLEEIHYNVVKRGKEEGERHMDYFLGIECTKDKCMLRTRYTETYNVEGVEKAGDAWIKEFHVKDQKLEAPGNEYLHYMWGFIPSGSEKEGDTDNLAIQGLAGRFSAEVRDEPNPLGDKTIALSLNKTSFMPPGFYFELEFDHKSGLLVSLAKVDQEGYLAVDLVKK